MDQELKQRLIGAVVVTALAAIFIPMLFDDPVDQSGQVVSELAIPEAPVKAAADTGNKLPANADEVMSFPEQGLTQDEEDAIVTDEVVPLDSEAAFVDPGAEDMASEEAIDEAVMEPRIAQPVPSPAVEDKAAITAMPKEKTIGNIERQGGTQPKSVAKPVPPKVAAVEKSAAKVIEPAKPAIGANKAAPAKSAAGLSRWYIQVGSYGQEANAMAMWNALRKQGFPVLMETIHLPEKGTLYRLKVGPELDQKRAVAMKEKLDKQNNLKTLLRAE
jgi:DedD protein